MEVTCDVFTRSSSLYHYVKFIVDLYQRPDIIFQKKIAMAEMESLVQVFVSVVARLIIIH